MGKGGKGPGGSSGGLSGTTMGMIALFAGLIIIMGGLALGENLGWFSNGGASECDTLEGRQIHEHADVLVFLDSDEPVDFSPPRYQVQEGFLHFEGGQSPPDRIAHMHEARPTLGCLFGTINWQVSEDRIVTDQGDEYVAEDGYEIHVLEDDVRNEEDFPKNKTFRDYLIGPRTYVVVYKHVDDPFPDYSEWAGTAMRTHGG